MADAIARSVIQGGDMGNDSTKAPDGLHRFLETRTVKAELRAEPEFVIEGYAALFDAWSEQLGFFKEKIKPGAFDETLKQSDIRALFNHDPNYPLGRVRAGTLEAKEDSKGLWYRVKLDENVSYAKDLYSSIKRGDVSQNSFSFRTLSDEWNEKGDERTLTKVALYDVGPVTFPAYPQTTVNARDLFAEMNIDHAVFSKLLFRAENGLPMVSREKDQLREYVKILAGRVSSLESARAVDVKDENKNASKSTDAFYGLPHDLYLRLRDCF
jgi:HK97 family phage prohead protease